MTDKPANSHETDERRADVDPATNPGPGEPAPGGRTDPSEIAAASSTASTATMRFGTVVVNADIAGTVVFGVTAAYAAIAFTTTAQWVGAVTALVLFAIGTFAFLWSYYNAVQRSRHEQISVTQLYLLAGAPTPTWVKVRMWGALVAQVLIATITALARPNGPDGNPGSSLAVGFLVPMFGLGLNGLWAAFHGRFPPRELTDDAIKRQRRSTPARADRAAADGATDDAPEDE